MFTVYVQYFKNANGTINNNQTQMFTIPQTNRFPIDKPVVKGSEDAADSFSFKMEADSPYYDALIQFKTRIRVDYDGDTIFYGHVLSINTSTLYQTKQVNCAGAYAFMNDTHYEGVQEKFRKKITVSEYLNKILTNHNTYAPAKAISRGNVTNPLPSETDRYEPTSWSQTASLIGNLKNEFGGHFRVRYTNGTCYLDWYKYFLRDLGDGNRPSVTIKKNIFEISSNSEVDNIFTRVIPYGSSNSKGGTIYLDGYKYTDKNGTQHTFSGKVFPVSLIPSLYTDNQLTDEYHSATDYVDPESTYGVIYKPQSFPNATNQAKLWEEAKKWIKDSFFGLATSFSIKAFDLHMQDSSIPKILVGDRVDINYYIYENGALALKTKKYVCKSIQYDLFNPENNTYSFGVPSDLLDRNGRKYSQKAASNASETKNKQDKQDNDVSLTFQNIANIILEDQDGHYGQTDAYDSFVANGPLSGTVYCYDPDEMRAQFGDDYDVYEHKNMWLTATLVGKITIPGQTTKYVAFADGANGGIFAFVSAIDLSRNVPRAITHWYLHNDPKKVYKYSSPTPYGIIDFDEGLIEITDDMLINFGTSIGNTVKTYFTIDPTTKQLTLTDVGNNDPILQLASNTITLGRKALGGAIDTAVKFGEILLGKPFISLFNGLTGQDNAETIHFSGEDALMNIGSGLFNFIMNGSEGLFELSKTSGGHGPSPTDVPLISFAAEGGGPTIALADDSDPNAPRTIVMNGREATMDLASGLTKAIIDGSNGIIELQKKQNAGATSKPMVSIATDSTNGPHISVADDTDPNFAKTIALNGRNAKVSVKDVANTKEVSLDGSNSQIDISSAAGAISLNGQSNVMNFTKGTGVAAHGVMSIAGGTNGPVIEMSDDTDQNYAKTIALSGRQAKVSVKDVANTKEVSLDGTNSQIDVKAAASKITVNGTNNAMTFAKLVSGASKPIIGIGDSASGAQLTMNDDVNNYAKTILMNGRNSTLDLRTAGEVPTVSMDGKNSTLNMYNTAGTNTAAISGVRQRITVGRDENNAWRVAMNELVTYTDEDGVEHHDTPGFVVAKDMKIDDVPSFKTQLAVIDTLIANKVDAVQISADMAYLRKIRGDTIQANTSVRSAAIYASTTRSANYYGDNYYLDDGNGGVQANLGACFSGASFAPGTGDDAGKIFLTLTRAHGRSGTDLVINFNMADTAFYQDAVSAANDTGWNAARTIVVNTLPTSSNQRSAVDGTAWTLRVPKTGYNSGYNSYNVIGDIADYTIPGQQGATVKVCNVKIGDYVAYRREIKLETVNVTPTSSAQEITPSSGYVGIKKVNVASDANGRTAGWNAARDVITATLPTSSTQRSAVDGTAWTLHVPKSGYNSGSDNYSVIGEIADYTAPGAAGAVKVCNIKIGSYIAYRKQIPLEAKGTVNPTSSAQTITPSSGYVGIKSITIGSDATAKDTGWNAARTIVVNTIPTSSTQRSAVDGTGWTLNIPKTGYNSGSDAYTVIGEIADYTAPGASGAVKVCNIKIGSYIAYRKQIALEAKGTITPTTSNQSITPGSSYVGIKSLTVAGSSNLTSANIKNGVSIFGVTGNYRGYLRTPSAAVTPTTSNQTITPGNDSGGTAYDGLTQVVVAGSSNLTAGNIKSGVSIFGVTGTYAPSATISADTYTDPSTDITGSIYAKNGNTTLDTKSLYMNNGSWTNGKIAINARVGTTSGDVTSRLWLNTSTPTNIRVLTSESPSGYTKLNGTTVLSIMSASKSISFSLAGKNYYFRVERG